MKKLLALTVLASAIGFAAPVIQFSLVNPNLTGEVGSVVGWGFSLHVDVTDLDASTYYVLATGSDYAPNVGAVGYSKGSTVSFPGDADVIGINQGPLTPGYVSNGGPDWAQPFFWNGGLIGSTGVRAFQICATISDPDCASVPNVGDTETGFLTIKYQYSTTATFDDFGNFAGLAGDITDAQTSPFSVSVAVEAPPPPPDLGDGGSTTPEPGTLALVLGGGLIALGCKKRR